MTLDNNIPLDISCLYAAKNVVPYIALRKPEAPKGTTAINKMQEILEAEGREAVDSVSSLEDLAERNPQASETELKRIFSETYQSIMLKVRGDYETLKDSGVLTEDDENEFEKFFTDFHEEDMPLFIYSMATASARKQDAEYGDELAEEEDILKNAREKREQYLASMQINTPEGDIAEVIMSSSGRRIWSAMKRGFVRVTEKDFENIVEEVIDVSLYYLCQREIPIENPEEVRIKATEWLFQEIKVRLDQRLEFGMLDNISIRKGDDGFIYVKGDIREPYTIVA